MIDHTNRLGRPDRLVFLSIGDELRAKCIIATDARHPQVRDYRGKRLSVTNQTSTEVALAMPVDEAMNNELRTYGRRHLSYHSSWTLVRPTAETVGTFFAQ